MIDAPGFLPHPIQGTMTMRMAIKGFCTEFILRSRAMLKQAAVGISVVFAMTQTTSSHYNLVAAAAILF
ncbi:MAG TPA: hypothetical protein QF564_19700 [Pirellulaceae bacterium]|nr:hypothetical protein [Pirellulaceae bacterium]